MVCFVLTAAPQPQDDSSRAEEGLPGGEPDQPGGEPDWAGGEPDRPGGEPDRPGDGNEYTPGGVFAGVGEFPPSLRQNPDVRSCADLPSMRCVPEAALRQVQGLGG